MNEIFTSNIGFPAVLVKDTSTTNCLFFNNGIFLYDYDIAYFNLTANKKLGFYNRGGNLWGIYNICKDTIKAQFIESPGGMSWEFGEVWFKIIDKNTIQQLYFKYREPISTDEIKQYQNKNISPAKFVQSDTLPDPYKCWLIKRKWFWCDKNNYKIFMKKIESEMRNKRKK